jgi:hypothetical protein
MEAPKSSPIRPPRPNHGMKRALSSAIRPEDPRSKKPASVGNSPPNEAWLPIRASRPSLYSFRHHAFMYARVMPRSAGSLRGDVSREDRYKDINAEKRAESGNGLASGKTVSGLETMLRFDDSREAGEKDALGPSFAEEPMFHIRGHHQVGTWPEFLGAGFF